MNTMKCFTTVKTLFAFCSYLFEYEHFKLDLLFCGTPCITTDIMNNLFSSVFRGYRGEIGHWDNVFISSLTFEYCHFSYKLTASEMAFTKKCPKNGCILEDSEKDFNPLRPGFPILNYLKTSENLWFSDVFRGYTKGTLGNMG